MAAGFGASEQDAAAPHGCHLGEREPGVLELADRLAELRARVRVRDALLELVLHGADEAGQDGRAEERDEDVARSWPT